MCNFDIQIVVQSQLTDISKYLSKIKRMQSDSIEELKEMSDDYIDFVQDIVGTKQNVLKKFYIVIKGNNNVDENISKIQDALMPCGNVASVCNTEEIVNIMKNCFSRRLRGLERNRV